MNSIPRPLSLAGLSSAVWSYCHGITATSQHSSLYLAVPRQTTSHSFLPSLPLQAWVQLQSLISIMVTKWFLKAPITCFHVKGRLLPHNISPSFSKEIKFCLFPPTPHLPSQPLTPLSARCAQGCKVGFLISQLCVLCRCLTLTLECGLILHLSLCAKPLDSPSKLRKKELCVSILFHTSMSTHGYLHNPQIWLASSPNISL